MAIGYNWVCSVCGATNPAGTDGCRRCGADAIMSGGEILEARRRGGFTPDAPVQANTIPADPPSEHAEGDRTTSGTPVLVNAVSADQPQEDPENDLFGHAPFAKHLADSIRQLRAPRGIVLALYGAWGSGKTTVLNFVKYYLKQSPDAGRMEVLPFNPWWFAGTDNLAHAFLGQLQAVLPGKARELRELRDLLADLSGGLGGIAAVATGHVWFKPLSLLIRRSKPQDVPELKRKIAKILSKFAKTIVVIVDDIDRLDADECRQVFKVIKALADFPNVVYVLAFDRDRTASALFDDDIAAGREYLEKFIQVPFDLPSVDQTAIHRMFFAIVERSLGGVDEKEFDQQHWQRCFVEGIGPLLRVPRDVVRVTNALGVTFGAVRGEVNTVDFIALEALRVFVPGVYTVIRENGERFVGYNPIGADKPKQREFHDQWLSTVSPADRDAVKALVTRLFPRLESVWSNVHYAAERAQEWRRKKRICSENFFPVYFRLAVQAGELSSQEFQLILNAANDETSLSEFLLSAAATLRPDGTSKARAILDRLTDHIGAEINADNAPSVIRTMFRVGDELLLENDSHRYMFDLDNLARVGRVVYHSTKQLEEATRVPVLTDAIERGTALRTTAFVVGAFMEESEKAARGEGQSLLKLPDAQALSQLFVLKVRQAVQEGSLIVAPELPSLLARWKQWTASGEPEAWLKSVIAGDQGLFDLLSAVTLKSYRESGRGPAIVTRYIPVKFLSTFGVVDQIRDRIKSIRASRSLTPRETELATLFEHDYQHFQAGRDDGVMMDRE